MNKLTVTVAVVALIVGALFGWAVHGGFRFGGVTNLDGLALGADGLTVTGSTTLSGGLSLSGGAVTNSGSNTENGSSTFTGGLLIGTTGTSLNRVISGTCNLVGLTAGDTIGFAAAVTASCAVTGATSTDRVMVQLANNTDTVFITGSGASTTDGFISVNLRNASTTRNTSVTAIGTSTKFLLIR